MHMTNYMQVHLGISKAAYNVPSFISLDHTDLFVWPLVLYCQNETSTNTKFGRNMPTGEARYSHTLFYHKWK